MADLLLWLYLINSILLIIHEIDSAYWKEWELFELPGEITGFLVLHFPILFFILWGLILIARHSSWGWVFSLLLCFGGLFAFSIHTWFLRKGRTEFNKPVSKIILATLLIISVIQIIVTIILMV